MRKKSSSSRFPFALALVACHAKNSEGTPDASAPAPSVSSLPAPPASAAPEATVTHHATPVPAQEARRTRVAKLTDEPALGAPELAKAIPAAPAYDVQLTSLARDGRRAALVSIAGQHGPDAKPFLAVVEESGAVTWTRDRPAGGILPPYGAIALAAGPKGRVALAVCDEPTRSVALRLIDDDGSPFADVQALEVDACDDVSLLYWPHHGFLLVAVSAGTTRARLFTETGSFGWGRGLDLGARSRPGLIAPASLAADTDDSFVLVQAAQPTGEGAFHALAFRYDASGAPIWKAAIDLGELRAKNERLVVEPVVPAGVRVRGAGMDVEVRPSGDVRGRALR